MKCTKPIILLSIVLLLFCSCSAGTHNVPKPNPDGKVDTTDLDTISRVYVRTFTPSGGAFLSSWDSAGELEADTIICYVAYNNLLNKQTEDPKLNVHEGGEYVDNYAPAQAVENCARQYFDVSVDFLRSHKLYEYDGHPDSYLLPDGYGGGGWNVVLGATQQDNILQVEIGVGGPDDMEVPSIKGILSIELGEGTFRYLSYRLTQHPKGI